MIANAETIDKLNKLPEESVAIIVGLIDYFSKNNRDRGVNVFRKAREEGKINPMTEDEVDELVSSVRRNMNARSN